MSNTTAVPAQIPLGPGPVIDVLVDWYDDALANLLGEPHITIPKLPGGLHGGPGPVDLFGTAFNKLFAGSASGVVNGDAVDRAALETKLANLQARFNKSTVSFDHERQTPEFAVESGTVHSVLRWTDAYNNREHIVTGANIIERDGSRLIQRINLSGKAELFELPIYHEESQ